ncbi:MAG: type II secretion system F family protein [Planctomycetaceae bacterium]|nr:type II secretion system F family protein [Planctomycetaceae bacterium]
MSPIVISVAAFIGVTALVGAVAMLVRDRAASRVDDRLTVLTGNPAAVRKSKASTPTLMTRNQETGPGYVEKLLARFANLHLICEQADTRLTMSKFVMLSAALAAFGGLLAALSRSHAGLVPLAAIVMGSTPTIWLMLRRRSRLKKFATQLPDALELISRALRAGHSLGAGFNLVQEEMAAPIGQEFGRAFEEQNLGLPLDESLQGMTERVPNLDLKFFATAVVLQRQTGGDLAEILDKIGSLIRERFKIWGQVQALTGEGRLSGVVLLALPPLLFVAVYRLNPDYIMTLFTDPMGKKMLAGAIVMQLVGALVIRKIVNIQV